MDFKIDGFLNISFGEKKQSTIEKIKDRNGILDLENSIDESLVFDNIKFAGRETVFTAFHFVDDKFCRAMVFLKANLESKTVELYQKIKEEITEKYFRTNQDYEIYEYPFQKNDGHLETAISIGKANFSSFWTFKNNQSNQDDYISMKIDENFHIIIIYENGELMKKYENNKNQNNFQDY
jgi:hypothetical protein